MKYLDEKIFIVLTLSWRRPLSYRDQSIDLLCKSMEWFLYDNGLRQERVKVIWSLAMEKLTRFLLIVKMFQIRCARTCMFLSNFLVHKRNELTQKF